MTWNEFAQYMTVLSVALAVVARWLWQYLEWWD